MRRGFRLSEIFAVGSEKKKKERGKEKEAGVFGNNIVPRGQNREEREGGRSAVGTLTPGP